jgi:hypothetical protein
VIFVTGFDSALTAAEIEFLGEVDRHVGKLFLVINKRDLVSGQAAEEVMGFVRRRLHDDLHLDDIRTFALSALQALQARTGADDERLAASGLPALEAALVQFLTTEKATLFLHTIAARAEKLVASQRRDLRLGRLATDGGRTRRWSRRRSKRASLTLTPPNARSPARSRSESKPSCRRCWPPEAQHGKRSYASYSPPASIRPYPTPTAHGRGWNGRDAHLSANGWADGPPRYTSWSSARWQTILAPRWRCVAHPVFAAPNSPAGHWPKTVPS